MFGILVYMLASMKKYKIDKYLKIVEVQKVFLIIESLHVKMR